MPERTFAWACAHICAFVWARAFVAFVHPFAFSPSFGLALRVGYVWACACVAFALSFTLIFVLVFAPSFGLTLGLLLRFRLRLHFASVVALLLSLPFDFRRTCEL